MANALTEQGTLPATTGPGLLCPGDRLTRDEFERRYAQMPGLKKAELIEGIIYMSPPVSTESHGAPHADLVFLMGFYKAHTLGVQVADNATVRLDWDNEPQPDALLRILPEHGGQSRNEDGYIALAPELTVEITSSSHSYDLHAKKDAYRRNGVREYIVWRVDERAVDWFILRGGRYDLLLSGDDGVHRSEVFPGFWLDTAALLSGDLRGALAVLQRGLESETHRIFQQRLQDQNQVAMTKRCSES